MFQVATGDSVLTITAGDVVVRKLNRTAWPGVVVVMTIPRDETKDWDGAYQSALASVGNPA
jgi:hypothetical protein